MVDGITPKLDSNKAAGKTIRIPLTYQVRRTGGSAATKSKPYNAPSFGINSYGKSRQAPSKQPGSTSRLGASAPQSIGELTDPGKDAAMEGREALPSTSASNGSQGAQKTQGPQTPAPSGGTQVPQSPLPERIPTSQEASGNNNSTGTSAVEGNSSETPQGGNPTENGNEGSEAEKSGERPTPAEEMARANNFQRAKDADEEEKSGGMSDVAGLDEMAENPVELMQAAQSGDTKKIRDKALEYLKKAVIREFIMPIIIGMLPNIIIGIFIFIAIIVVVIVIAAIVGEIPGVDVIMSITNLFHPPK